MHIEADLMAEIKKRPKKLDEFLLRLPPQGKKDIKMLQNIRAYRNDLRYFLGREDLIKSFECLIWTWSILELDKYETMIVRLEEVLVKLSLLWGT